MHNRLIIIIIALVALGTNSVRATDSFTPGMLHARNFMSPEMLAPASAPAANDLSEINSLLIADIINHANSYLGTRYKRGGKTPNGFDCSGFTGYIFKKFGISLAASSSSQFSNGINVDSFNDIRPGDLLFFKGSNSKSRSIGHVAIAIEAPNPVTGDVTFIHAAIKGGIRIDHTSAPYYSRRFVGARRVID